MRTAQLMAVMAAVAAAGALGVPARRTRYAESEAVHRPKSKPEDTTRRYCGMTDEQRAWNEAVDRKKASRAPLAAQGEKQ